jgi:hypothetical protein
MPGPGAPMRAPGGRTRVPAAATPAPGGSDAGSGGSDAGAGGSDAGAGGSDAGSGGSDAGAGGSDAGAGGSDAGAGGSDAGAGGSDAGAGGEAGNGNGCAPEELLCDGVCVNVQTSTNHCGICGVQCGSVNGEASCVAGVCELTCSPGFEKCEGSCVDLQSDTAHCGACGAKCSTAGGEATCDAGACKISCAAGFADCDSDVANGCEVNGSCACAPGEVVDCYDGAEGTKDVGVCKGGTKTCNAEGTGFGACEGQIIPAAESCDGALTDEDCDGQVNEAGGDPSCVCTPGSQTACYEGPPGTAGVGLCKGGLRTCNAEGTAFGACEGQIIPAAESCAANALTDEDCDGQVNESGAGCACAPNSFQPCYDNGLNSPQLQTPSGLCVAGIALCKPDGTGYDACQGQILPTAEICDVAGVDEDCDGQSNEGGAGCECVPGAVQNCWEGPANAVFGGASVCKQGTRTCQGSGKWGGCQGQVLPGFEPQGVCTANIDEDCDGERARARGAGSGRGRLDGVRRRLLRDGGPVQRPEAGEPGRLRRGRGTTWTTTATVRPTTRRRPATTGWRATRARGWTTPRRWTCARPPRRTIRRRSGG